MTATDPNTIATVAGGDGGPLNQLSDFIPALTNMNLAHLTGLTYTTGPLQAPVTAAGPATLDLKLSSTLPATQIWAVISDVAPGGQSRPMAVGRLNTAFPGIVESKSLKLYLQSFRNHGAFHEDCTVGIARRLVGRLRPKWLRIGGYWYPRGGMPIDVFWQTGRPPAGVWLPEQGVAAYRGRG